MAAEIISTGFIATEAAPDESADPSSLADDLSSPAEVRLCEVPDHMHGWRLDRALASLIPEFSRAHIQQLIANGAVRLHNAATLKQAMRTHAAQAIHIELRPTQQATAFVPQPMVLDIVFEDDDLLVLNKPAGLVVHPAAGNWSGTLLNGLLAHHTPAATLPRAGIVHRLDKDTSGLMLVGKTQAATLALSLAIAARQVHRQYLAIAHGTWLGPTQQDINQPIGRDTRNRLRMAVVPPDLATGKPAKTTVQLIEHSNQASLIACKLHTGRTHQIRVHMAWLGHPLIADTLYGGREQLGMHRQALHAARLCLKHPTNGQTLQFQIPPPADFIAAINHAQFQYNRALAAQII